MEIDITLDNDPLAIELTREAKLKGITLEKLISEILQEYVEIENENKII